MTELHRDSALSEVGEHVLIAEVGARLKQGTAVGLGPGDDAALLWTTDGRIVVSTDVLVEGRHFKPVWSSAHDVGRRAAAASMADIAAMGAKPTALVVALVLPPTTTVGWVFDFVEGLTTECELVGASVAGGDFAGGDQIVVSATVLGDLEGRQAVTRAGARVGDVVAFCGRLGWAAGGLTVLSRGFKAPRQLVEAHRFPAPPYAAGPLAADAGATSMIDVSDGLVADLAHVAKASDVTIAIDTSLVVINDPVRDAAAAFNFDPLLWVLAGGDDHALVATFPADAEVPEGFTVIGQVLEAGVGDRPVLVDGVARADLSGFDHYR
ncbi:MAG: thiamine-phosphate kinase [Actinomycetes bacterium]